MSGSAEYRNLSQLRSMAALQLAKKRLRTDMRRNEQGLRESCRNGVDMFSDLFGSSSSCGRHSGRRSSGRCDSEWVHDSSFGGNCTCRGHSGGGRRSRWNIALGLLGDLGGVQGIIRSALYGYRLVGNIAELYRRKHNNCGDTEIVLEEMVEK